MKSDLGESSLVGELGASGKSVGRRTLLRSINLESDAWNVFRADPSWGTSERYVDIREAISLLVIVACSSPVKLVVSR